MVSSSSISLEVILLKSLSYRKEREVIELRHANWLVIFANLNGTHPVGGAVVEDIFNIWDKHLHCRTIIILQVLFDSAQHHGTTNVLTASWNLQTRSGDITCMFTTNMSFKWSKTAQRWTEGWDLHWCRGQSCTHAAGVTADTGSAGGQNTKTTKYTVIRV